MADEARMGMLGGRHRELLSHLKKHKETAVGFIRDFVLFSLVAIPIPCIYFMGVPYARGFFCDDESLRHPFKDSTIPSWSLYIVGLLMPAAVMLLVEYVAYSRHRDKHPEEIPDIRKYLEKGYHMVGSFAFGAACCQLLTDIGKYTIGRLRPHFITLCDPVLKDGSKCNEPHNFGMYVENYTCATKLTQMQLREMRLSFPSGHSSCAVYTMLYLSLFLQYKVTWRNMWFVRSFLQFVCLLMAWYTCLSRIIDYKHHWSDVLGGAVLGTTMAFWAVYFVANLHKVDRHGYAKKKKKQHDDEEAGEVEPQAAHSGQHHHEGHSKHGEHEHGGHDHHHNNNNNKKHEHAAGHDH